MAVSAIQKNHIYSTYFAPRGRMRIYNLGIQIAQLYLSPFDKLIGVIGESGSGKSVLIKGMFPGLELTTTTTASTHGRCHCSIRTWSAASSRPTPITWTCALRWASTSSRSWLMRCASPSAAESAS